MIQLHCTQKLFAKLPLDAGGRLQSRRSPVVAANDEPPIALSGWHANLVLLQRRQCALFVHDATRFPVLGRNGDSVYVITRPLCLYH